MIRQSSLAVACHHSTEKDNNVKAALDLVNALYVRHQELFVSFLFGQLKVCL